MRNASGAAIVKDMPMDWESLGASVMDQCNADSVLVHAVARCLNEVAWMFDGAPVVDKQSTVKPRGDFSTFFPTGSHDS